MRLLGGRGSKNNFIRIEKGAATGNSSFTQSLGANSYWFNTYDDLGGSTTPAHELGHGLGLPHSQAAGQTKTSRPEN